MLEVQLHLKRQIGGLLLVVCCVIVASVAGCGSRPTATTDSDPANIDPNAALTEDPLPTPENP